MPASLFTFDVDGKVLEVGVIAADDSTAQGLPAPFYLATHPAPEHLA
ncbi:class I SAM-dependent methyltransferase, partial [Alcaligenes pakistanensis]